MDTHRKIIMKKMNGVSKGKLFAFLRTLGIWVIRDHQNHAWKLSNGETFQSLAAIQLKYHA